MASRHRKTPPQDVDIWASPLGYDETMAASDYMSNQFLIAMPGMEDPNFSRSVTYVCQHNDSGALGITINRSSDLTVGDVLEQLEIKVESPRWADEPVLIGGPVHQDRGFVLHNRSGDEWNSSFTVTPEIALTTSKDILEAMAQGSGPEQAILALGYAGWSAGQLETEILQNAWLHTSLDTQILFDSPLTERWHEAAAALGVDIDMLTGAAGHA